MRLLESSKDTSMTSTLTPSKSNHPAFSRRDASGKRIPRRGDLWFISSDSSDRALGSHRSVGHEIWSNRLAVVLSNNRMNSRAGFVQVVYLATAAARTPSRLHPQVDFPADLTINGTDTAVAFCEQVHSVDRSRLMEFHGCVEPDDLAEIASSVRWALGLNHDDASTGD